MITKENIKIGKKVAYASFIDEDGNPGCDLIECTITDGPFEMCGTDCRLGIGETHRIVVVQVRNGGFRAGFADVFQALFGGSVASRSAAMKSRMSLTLLKESLS